MTAPTPKSDWLRKRREETYAENHAKAPRAERVATAAAALVSAEVIASAKAKPSFKGKSAPTGAQRAQDKRKGKRRK